MQGFLHELVGSMSQGADGNPTVAMVEATFAHHGLHWRYVNLEVAPGDLADAVRGARAMGFRGFNLSIPHKVHVIGHLDRLGRSAEIIGAVNCVVREGDELVGENTDGKGFLAALARHVDPRGAAVTLLGAGGAARAIAVELALAGARTITIVNRNAGRGSELATLVTNRCRVTAHWAPWTDSTPHAVDAEHAVLVNATSVGLYDPDTMPLVDTRTLRAGLVVADVVFNPVDTMLLRTAAASGAVTVDGLGMLVEQGAEAIRRWTGVDPDRIVMDRALRQAMALDGA